MGVGDKDRETETLSLKTYPQKHTSSNKAALPNPYKLFIMGGGCSHPNPTAPTILQLYAVQSKMNPTLQRNQKDEQEPGNREDAGVPQREQKASVSPGTQK